MNEIKVLVWNTFKLLERHGGPPTYLYNLKKSAEENKLVNIDFVNDYNEEPIPKPKNKIKSFFKKVFNIQKKEKVKKSYTKEDYLTYLNHIKESLPQDIKLNEYDFIHFHTTFDYYHYRELLKEYKGKILLTSHSPKVTHKEIFEEWMQGLILNEEEKEQVKAIDEFAFSNADYVIFPCVEAQEPYYNSWKDYTKVKFKNEIKELLTCTVASEIRKDKNEVLKEFNIPESAFIINYFGRHNDVKGYSLLKEAGIDILEKYPNIYFLIAGKEEPLKGLNHERWIEVGWTNDPHSLVAASDLFVLPNKETYFDLALLEVLSVGTRCLISNTGGNKYFKKLSEKETCGIHYFEPNNKESLINELDKIYTEENLNNNNKELFIKYFDNRNFASNYIKTLENLK